MEFYYAVKENDSDRLRALAREHPDLCRTVKPYDQGLLLHAAFNGQAAIAEYLIGQGCDVNEKDGKGYTPLLGAVEYDQLDVARILLDHGAKVDAKDNFGNTPLLNAVFHSKGKTGMVRQLLSYGANPMEKNDSGISPLAFAEKTGQQELIDLLKHTKP